MATLAGDEDKYDSKERETLEKVLKQGLKEEHKQYKDGIIEFLTNMQDRIKAEDLTLYPF